MTLLIWLLAMPLTSAYAADPVRIGVLAFRTKPQALAQWQPLAAALKQAIPERDFVIEVFSYPELDMAVATRQLDFVLTNPGHYVLLMKRSGLSAPLATLAEDAQGKAITVFGGVIFSRANTANINSLADLKGRIIAATSTEAMSGYQAQVYELNRQGVRSSQDAKLLITGVPHDNVVDAVLSGRADAGFVRTGVLEDLVREGKLDMARIKVLNRQNLPGYPVQVSTRLYPEWPFAALPHVDENLSRYVAAALFRLEENPVATKAIGIHGFVIPADYTPVSDMLHELRLPPFDVAPEFTLHDVWNQYRWWIIFSLVAAGLTLLLGMRLLVNNRKLNAERRITLLQNQQLDESERRYHFLFNNNPMPMWVFAEDNLRFLEVNERALEHYGFTREEFGRMTLRDIRPAEDIPELNRVISGSHDGKVSTETRHKKKGGALIDVVISTMPMKYGAATARIVLIQDITERKKVEKALKDSEQRFRDIVNSTDGIVWEADAFTFDFTFISQQAERLLGYPIEDWLKPGFWVEHLHPDDKDWASEYCASCTRRLEQHDFEYRFIAMDGRTVWLRDLVTVVDENGMPRWLRGIMMDTTERKRVEEELKLSAQLLNSTSDTVFLLDPGGNFVYLNDAAWKSRGYTRDEMMGMSLRELNAPEFNKLLAPRIKAVMENGHGFFESAHRCKDGSVMPVEINVRVIESGGRKLMLSVIRDITERKAIQKQMANQLAFTEAIINAEVNALAVCHGIAEPPYVCFTIWNPSMEALTGYGMEEINRLGWYQTVHVDPEVQEQARQRMERMRQGDHLRGEEWVITRKNGERRVAQIYTVTVAEDDWGTHTLAVMHDITGRKHAEMQLKNSEERYRQIIQTSMDGFWISDTKGRILDVNDAYCQLVGYTREELLNMRIMDIEAKETPEETAQHIQEIMTKGHARFETHHRRKDGQLLFIEVSAVYRTDAGSGNFFVFMRNITERKHAEKELRKKNQLLDSIVENIPNMIFLKRASDLRFELFNRAGEVLVGHSRDELLGRNDYDFFPKEQADFFIGKDRATLEQDSIVDIAEEPIETPRGTRILHTRKLALRDEQGQPQYLLGISEDITERKQVEAVLKRHKTVIDTAQDGFWMYDTSGYLLEVNQAYADMMNYTREELAGMHISRLSVLSNTPELVMARMEKIISQKSSSHFETQHRHKDGHIIHFETSNTFMPESNLVFSFLRDITERKEHEEELKRSNAELEQFSYAVSHDMRQPLRMISSYLQLLERSLAGQLDNEKRGYFSFAIEGAKRIDQMLVALLEYSRIGRMGEQPTWIESRTVIDEALQFLQPTLDEAQAKLSITGEWPRIFASHDEILRLLQNLIGNAAKYRIAGRTPEITVTSWIVKNEWHLCVADNGVGIIPDQIKRLFQVFQRLQSREAYEGTGIGLALCRKIAEHHKGHIWAESAGEGLGSKFCVVLPVLRDVQPPRYEKTEPKSHC